MGALGNCWSRSFRLVALETCGLEEYEFSVNLYWADETAAFQT